MDATTPNLSKTSWWKPTTFEFFNLIKSTVLKYCTVTVLKYCYVVGLLLSISIERFMKVKHFICSTLLQFLLFDYLQKNRPKVQKSAADCSRPLQTAADWSRLCCRKWSKVEESGGKWRKVEESWGKWRKVEESGVKMHPADCVPTSAALFQNSTSCETFNWNRQ